MSDLQALSGLCAWEHEVARRTGYAAFEFRVMIDNNNKEYGTLLSRW
jgi:hypothetical protein